MSYHRVDNPLVRVDSVTIRIDSEEGAAAVVRRDKADTGVYIYRDGFNDWYCKVGRR